MMKFIICIYAIMLSSCSLIDDKEKILLCPKEYRERIEPLQDLSQQRMILFKADYEVVIITAKDQEIIPVQHYRPEHTFSGRSNPILINTNRPLHISSFMIYDVSEEPKGCLIRKVGDNNWRIFWFDESMLKIGNIIYLPEYKEMAVTSF